MKHEVEVVTEEEKTQGEKRRAYQDIARVRAAMDALEVGLDKGYPITPAELQNVITSATDLAMTVTRYELRRRLPK